MLVPFVLVEFLILVQIDAEKTGQDCALGQLRLGDLAVAVFVGNVEFVQLLLAQEKIDVNRLGDYSGTALHTACLEGNQAIAKMLLSQGNADINATNADDETVLTWARKRGHAGLINLLVEAGGAKKSNSKTRDIPKREIVFNAANRQQLLKKSIKKSISLLQHSSDVFLKNRESCVSCHHQNLPAIAIGWARDRGFQVNDDSNQRMIEHLRRSMNVAGH